MEHEVFVPAAAGPLRQALADPHRVARAIPGLQQDAGEPPLTGRLKVRIGSSSITYRGTLRVEAEPDGTYTVHGEAEEARGEGTVTLTLTVRLTETPEGTTLTITGGAEATGRLASVPPDTARTAGHRLLQRCATSLAETPAPTEPDEEPAPEPEPPSGEDAPAEAAHARRTMIGRSAEEVDHAPPRGRYAPVPVPEAFPAGAALRWAAPAAAAAVAGAIILTRALRRRH
ncbi:SRPBCC domain-containing protein [Streptomyces sp. NPDC058045]|uniref:SRPBCC domain-containing protein n=1 Tax=Streptomyces sp. NPDC058045 TaxID=3346311 RepID=UPI0036EE57D7